MQAVFLAKISLHSFRNHYQKEFTFNRGLNILVGPNGAGKTNLLEAIAYLSIGRSFRYHQDKDLISLGSAGFRLHGLVYREQRKIEITLVYHPGKKELTINREPQRLLELLGIIPTITFSPDDLYLVKGSPAIRRQFLDREISQLDRSYCHSLLTYRRVLNQRNLLLRQIKAGQAREEELQPWDQQLVSSGIALVKKRGEVVEKWSVLARQFYASLVEKPENIYIYYRPSLKAEEDWFRALSLKRAKEIAQGSTLLGPHRDDFTFEIAGKEGRYFASQGEQRSLVLALKLAEVVYFTEVLRFRPVLLLDDVFSELDGKRKRALLNLINHGGQTFITTTDVAFLPAGSLDGGAIIKLTPG